MNRDDRGVKPTELGVGLLLVGVLAAAVIPVLNTVFERVDEARAALEVRNAAVPAKVGVIAGDEFSSIEEALVGLSGSAPGREAEVAGVALERSEDGAVCLWSEAASGTVFGIWENAETTLYGRFQQRPDSCPIAAEAEAVGFGPSF